MIGAAGCSSTKSHSSSMIFWSTTATSRPALPELLAEDVAEPRADHHLEPVVLQRPDRVLARRAGAEVGTGDQDRRAGVLRLVEHEVRVVAPGREQPVLEAGLGHPLQVDRRDDLVGVDIAAPQAAARCRCGWSNLSMIDRSPDQIGG